jgi:hypothetical protein
VNRRILKADSSIAPIEAERAAFLAGFQYDSPTYVIIAVLRPREGVVENVWAQLFVQEGRRMIGMHIEAPNLSFKEMEAKATENALAWRHRIDRKPHARSDLPRVLESFRR